MRGAFIRRLAELAERDSRLVLLTGDLGYLAIEPFAARYPDRFFNVGVAEQNMVGLATGLAESGLLPFVYSIVTFATLRPYEFIRNGPVLQRLPVRIIGVGGGFEYGSNGLTHYGLEDVGVLRLQPDMMVVAPADHAQTVNVLTATYDGPMPVYYRLGKDDTSTVPGLHGRYDGSGVDIVRTGDAAWLVAMGSVALEAEKACGLLAKWGISCGLAIVSRLSPPPVEPLADLLRGCRRIVTVEAHYVTGGLGSLVAEVASDRGLPIHLHRCGVRDSPIGYSGSTGYLYGVHGLSADALARAVCSAMAAGASDVA
jgi:transketolase